jgi:Na+-driven multidrug efflux pump
LYRIFTDDPAIITHGANYLRIVAITEVFLAFEVILTGAFSGAGDTKPPFFIIFPITFSRIPLAYVFAVTFNYGVTIIWVIIALTTFFKGILLFYQFQKGHWARKKI